ncbi:MAG TPA: hypothetical protein VGL94_16570 [Ktedonobacteraceae bacterium]
MTLQNPDAQSAQSISHPPQQSVSPAHSISDAPATPALPPQAAFPKTLSSPAFKDGLSHKADHEHAIDFATSSWDLATGGLKTLTAKRELPLRPDRRSTGVVPDILATSRSYMFALVILVCVLLMLIGGGIVLFVMLQP